MREGLARRLAALLFGLAAGLPLLAAPAMAQDPPPIESTEPTVPAMGPRIGVATMQPGEIFWERFGHNALVVDDPALGPPVSYNFGFFDLSEPGFTRRFVRGRMEYMLVALPFADDLEYYRRTGRGVSIQWLDLDPGQASGLAAALAENARPENARYGYDYFTDNCSTRVRDALDAALDGELQRQWSITPGQATWRSESVRLASPAGWMWLGFDLGLGPRADRPLSPWEEAFVPMRLADHLRSTRRADGRPLVSTETVLLPHRIAPEPAPEARPWWPYALAGLLGGVVLLSLGRHRPRWLAAAALPFWTLGGLLGLLMAFLWCCTAHWAGWTNHNLLLLNPLSLLLLPGAWRLARGRDPGRWFRPLLGVVALGALVAALLLLWPHGQRNAPWVALLLPIHAALFGLWALPRLFSRSVRALPPR